MLTWAELAHARPELAEAGRRLLYQFGVGLGVLATVRADGGPGCSGAVEGAGHGHPRRQDLGPAPENGKGVPPGWYADPAGGWGLRLVGRRALDRARGSRPTRLLAAGPLRPVPRHGLPRAIAKR
jgi:hypothetical protein